MTNAPINQTVVDSIVKDYVVSKLSNSEISNKYNIHRSTVQRILKRANIVLSKRVLVTKVNHNFFTDYNSKSCYWAGFILADGYIRPNRPSLEIKLQKKDVEHLNKFKADIGFEGKVTERDKYYDISISSTQIVSDLYINFDITNKKSLTCSISDKIPSLFLKDFIRGYFDGDGCITFTTTNTINILGTFQTLDRIRTFFFEEGVTLRSKDKPNIIHTGNIYQINYSGKSANKCLNILYSDADTFLDRKFNLYLKAQ